MYQNGQATGRLWERLKEKLAGSNLGVNWKVLGQDVGLVLNMNWTVLRDKIGNFFHLVYSNHPHVIVITSTQRTWYIPLPLNRCLGSLVTLKMEASLKILLSVIILTTGVKGKKNMMSSKVIEKLNPVDKKVGFYSMGQKAAHQEFLTIPHLDDLPILVKEMEEISVTVIRLDF